MNCRVTFCLVRVFISLIPLLFSACSSVFYQPSDRFFYAPKQFKLAPQPTWIATEDGAKLHAWYFQNTVKKENPEALIVFFHGNAENLTSHYISLIFTLESGFDFLIFDYRGYGLSESPIHLSRGTNYKSLPSQKDTIIDAKAVLRWAQARQPNTPLVIFAQSLGGAIAMRSLPELKEEDPLLPIKLVVVEGTFLSYQNTASKILARHWITWPLQWLSHPLISDWGSAENWVSKISPTPLVVIHGTNDPVIPFSLGEDVYNKASEPKEFWPVQGGMHIDAFHPRYKNVYRDRFILKIKQAIQK